MGYVLGLVAVWPFASALAVPRWFRFPFPPFRARCWSSFPHVAAVSFILIVGSRLVLVLVFRVFALILIARAAVWFFRFPGTSYWSTHAKIKKICAVN